MATPKALTAKFEDLFKSKENAVICYLSLERRYLDVCKRLRDRVNDAQENKCTCHRCTGGIDVASYYEEE